MSPSRPSPATLSSAWFERSRDWLRWTVADAESERLLWVLAQALSKAQILDAIAEPPLTVQAASRNPRCSCTERGRRTNGRNSCLPARAVFLHCRCAIIGVALPDEPPLLSKHRRHSKNR